MREMMNGDVEEGYGKVADAFRANLDSGLEVGAACSVYRDGRKVVDLWGGVRNHETGAPWESDTLVNVFSTTKGVASLTVAVAASRGLLDYDAKVADYWPEFAQNGKEAVTVRQLLAHQAGLAAITPPLALFLCPHTCRHQFRAATHSTSISQSCPSGQSQSTHSPSPC